MSKITLKDIRSGYDLSGINNNFQLLEEELNSKVMYRDNPIGEPNHSNNDIDLNSNDLLNVNEINVTTLRIQGDEVIPNDLVVANITEVSVDSFSDMLAYNYIDNSGIKTITYHRDYTSSDVGVHSEVYFVTGNSGTGPSGLPGDDIVYASDGTELALNPDSIAEHEAASDPHPQYLLPSELPSSTTVWFTDNDSALKSGYDTVTFSRSTEAESTAVVTCTVAGAPVLVGQWAREAALTSDITVGDTNTRYTLDMVSSTDNVTVYVTAAVLHTDDTETSLGTSNLVSVGTTRSNIVLSKDIVGGASGVAGDVIITRIYAYKTTTGLNPTLTFYMEGSTESRAITISQSVVDIGVSSFNGRTGDVVPEDGDYDDFYYTETEVDNLLSGKLSNLVEDLTPQLGGNLDVLDNTISSSSGDYVYIYRPYATGALFTQTIDPLTYDLTVNANRIVIDGDSESGLIGDSYVRSVQLTGGTSGASLQLIKDVSDVTTYNVQLTYNYIVDSLTLSSGSSSTTPFNILMPTTFDDDVTVGEVVYPSTAPSVESVLKCGSDGIAYWEAV